MHLISTGPLSRLCLLSLKFQRAPLWCDRKPLGWKVGGLGFRPSLSSDGSWQISGLLLPCFPYLGWDEMKGFQTELFGPSGTLEIMKKLSLEGFRRRSCCLPSSISTKHSTFIHFQDWHSMSICKHYWLQATETDSSGQKEKKLIKGY